MVFSDSTFISEFIGKTEFLSSKKRISTLLSLKLHSNVESIVEQHYSRWLYVRLSEYYSDGNKFIVVLQWNFTEHRLSGWFSRIENENTTKTFWKSFRCAFGFFASVSLWLLARCSVKLGAFIRFSRTSTWRKKFVVFNFESRKKQKRAIDPHFSLSGNSRLSISRHGRSSLIDRFSFSHILANFRSDSSSTRSRRALSFKSSLFVFFLVVSNFVSPFSSSIKTLKSFRCVKSVEVDTWVSGSSFWFCTKVYWW